ncbi:HAD family hydrolase [Novosphingobium flavum]|uniref:HAD family hydrolase n=1 Tax=Novosphingobium flavum TaxID=1778672 RepID=A0A7X1FQQ8_9SPHN|nr:HAD family hydrolase [Novosphingobium flavum]MBC2665064.1 HAD family hydrolase [Novosphingobium flavum]
MSRPLVVTDCDEVLLHMVVPWSEWLREQHGIAFSLNGNDFVRSMRRADGAPVTPQDVWHLLDLFFRHEMERQYPIAGAVAAMQELSHHADVVVLTNLTDDHRAGRAAQLLGHGLDLKVYTNQGPKGPALQRIHAEYAPSRAVFIDDIALHHGSVAELAPAVHRLHLCGEPQMAPHIRCAHRAGHAHARIDRWDSALPWLLARLNGDEND